MARRERYFRDSRGMMRAAVVGDVRERLPVSEAREKWGSKKELNGGDGADSGPSGEVAADFAAL